LTGDICFKCADKETQHKCIEFLAIIKDFMYQYHIADVKIHVIIILGKVTIFGAERDEVMNTDSELEDMKGSCLHLC
jgi:hypothetical protein